MIFENKFFQFELRVKSMLSISKDMKSLIVFACFLLCFQLSFAKSDCPISYSCNDTFIKNDDKVAVYCKESSLRNMTGRCCTENNTIIGLDLRFCEIAELNISLSNFSSLEILDLRHNDFKEFTSRNLIGFFKLDYLYLSSNIPCPGGKPGWNLTSVDNSTTSCLHQLNFCHSLNITCGDPENARCHHLGPGSANCQCCLGYSGYKCLNQGTFPTAVFCTSVAVPAVILSIALWFIQGRDVYKRVNIEN